ncbi:polysaccharide pyruvyl transferase WcaK-like protein [Marisediminicola sp. UYEF4]|uniref:polysaccharide pyruvyl transferase family protein n=1 Tax=Marisediminicola sp. UYEF4 TaxID=1756384 RepID=UPI0033989082
MTKESHMPRRQRAHIVGYYGMANFGDDLFCEVIRNYASHLLPGLDVKIVGDFARGKAKGTYLESLRAQLFSSNSPLGSAVRLAVGLNTVVRADLIVLGGGSVLSSVKGVWSVQNRLAVLCNTSFRALGVSIGPFAADVDRSAISVFANRFDRIVVRDNSSLMNGRELVSPAKVTLGGDLAALYVSPDVKVPRVPGIRRVGIALCNFPGFTIRELKDLISATVEALALTRSPDVIDHVFVISLNSNVEFGDDELSQLAARELTAANVAVSLIRYADNDVSFIWNLLGSLDALIAVRLHAAICAYMNSVPFVLLEYHQKCRDFCDDIGQLAALRAGAFPSQSSALIKITALLSGSRSTVALAPAEYAARARAIYFEGTQ